MKRALFAAIALVACNDRQVLHEPDPTLARMLDQRRADTWETTAAFADGKVMRTPPKDTVSRDDDVDDAPPAMTPELLATGRAKFDVVCATCHGVLGDGNSVVATKMEHRRPPSLHEARVKALSDPQLFTVVSDGYGLMPSVASMLTRRERWAVVAYVRALQLSQEAPVAALPSDLRAKLEAR